MTLINPIPAKGSGVFYELARRMPNVPFLAVEGGYQQSEQVRERLPNVRWQPHTGRMRQHVWAHTRVLLMPSAEESYGMCAIEAAASGIPTIAAPTPGLKEALGEAGVFVDVDDIDGWEAALRDITGPGWALASKKALARSAELNPGEELNQWVAAVESL
ncbi:glycosyltransferase [Klebsiella pneumoniae]|nr:glycosyltransferase [Klebsiella pneumoniae]